MSVCLMFPGQGTKAGMLRELGNQIEKANGVFNIAQQVTGRNIKDLCLTTTAEELQKLKTPNLQLQQ